MCAFGQSINDHPYYIVPFSCLGKLSHQIHRYMFPLPHWDLQGLQLSIPPLVFGFYLRTCQTLSNILDNVSFHSRPPIIHPQVSIHLCSSRMNGIPRLVSLIQ
ncbi:hypothetical protein HanIR_Chr02g0056891 [Helianthus annuus]|nr:hypothetical protein HanIR_Chr02g0056891 [Helianthus annuus]